MYEEEADGQMGRWRDGLAEEQAAQEAIGSG